MQTEAACWQLRTVELMFYATESRNFVVYKKGRQKISRISRTAACSHEVPQQPAVGDRHCSTTAIPTPRQGPAASRKRSQHLRELTTSKQSKQQKKKKQHLPQCTFKRVVEFHQHRTQCCTCCHGTDVGFSDFAPTSWGRKSSPDSSTDPAGFINPQNEQDGLVPLHPPPHCPYSGNSFVLLSTLPSHKLGP